MSESAVGVSPASAYGRHVTSSSLETPTHTTGAHRAHRRESRPSAQRTSARYEPYLDGLFTYCLSVLCDHEAATDALGSVLAIAERQDGRCPAAEEERKSWLYALARWTCLRALTEQRRGRQAHRRPSAPRGTAPREDVADPGPHGTPEEAAAPGCRTESPAAEARRRELAQLAWPEAAGTTPEQREALELAVRHGLTPRAVAAVLGLDPGSARELLAGAACEVERTRAALAVVEKGNCPAVARLTGTHRALLPAVLRRELVRHVDDCPRCRRAAERAGAAGPWPGATVTPAAALPVVEAPRPSVHVALTHARRSRSGAPRFGRTGFPLDPKDHAARRGRLRARVVTTTVVATVVAAPVIALWAAYRGAPLTGEGRGTSVTAADVDGGSGPAQDPYDHYANAGNARSEGKGAFTDGARTPGVSAEVVSVGTGSDGEGSLEVSARSSGGRTTITLTAKGDGTVAWSARVDAPWLHLSRTSGTVAPGRSVTLQVFVNPAAEPQGPWSARVLLAPSGSAVAITGSGAGTPRPGSPEPSPEPSSRAPSPTPSSPPPSTDPTPGPTEPTGPPDPTPTDTPGSPGPTPSPSGEPPGPDPSSGPTAVPGGSSGPAG
ncbi:sigma-70 family RNA polymerase sigma factor [Streptomyces atroolivaceus]|uniref:Sigma-70 family RNA polymerase sigma factor n=1 Tax=Streptomyces atroolivaceus TaxID=66869 RepID=A0ABV9VCH2_STRAZ|nr:sigma-70 family RNA polymerase sigma factor [Streptomyces atroolivaceus]